MLGHTKTVLVLLISWLFLGELMTARKLGGMALAVAGMVAYGYCVASCSTHKSSDERRTSTKHGSDTPGHVEKV